MFRITEDPSSGSLVQYLAEITKMVLTSPMLWTWSFLWQHILTRCVSVVHCLYSNSPDSELCARVRAHAHIHTRTHTHKHNDGSSVIRNMLEYLKYFVTLIVSACYLIVHKLANKIFINRHNIWFSVKCGAISCLGEQLSIFKEKLSFVKVKGYMMSFVVNCNCVSNKYLAN